MNPWLRAPSATDTTATTQPARLHVSLTTRARIWLEANDAALPDPFSPRDIVVAIEHHYPGGRREFLRDCGVYDTVKRRDRERIYRDHLQPLSRDPATGRMLPEEN